MKTYEIEKIREPAYQNRLDLFLHEEQNYLKSLKDLINTYGAFLKAKFPGNVLINAFFVNIAEIHEHHEKMLRKIRNDKRMGGRRLGVLFEEAFLSQKPGLLQIYKNYLAKLNRVLHLIQTRAEKTTEFFHSLLNKASSNRGYITHVGLMLTPASRLLDMLVDMDDFALYTKGINLRETIKLKQVRNKLAQVLGAGIHHALAAAGPGVAMAKVAEPVPQHQPSAKRRSIGSASTSAVRPRLVTAVQKAHKPPLAKRNNSVSGPAKRRTSVSGPAKRRTSVSGPTKRRTSVSGPAKRRSSVTGPPAKKRSIHPASTLAGTSRTVEIEVTGTTPKMTTKQALKMLEATRRKDLLKLTDFPLPVPMRKRTTPKKRDDGPKRAWQ